MMASDSNTAAAHAAVRRAARAAARAVVRPAAHVRFKAAAVPLFHLPERIISLSCVSGSIVFRILFIVIEIVFL